MNENIAKGLILLHKEHGHFLVFLKYVMRCKLSREILVLFDSAFLPPQELSATLYIHSLCLSKFWSVRGYVSSDFHRTSFLAVEIQLSR